jgi:hypothetical protein
MIQVNYRGRLGNNMFQYALGRRLAEAMGYKLSADPLPFAKTIEGIFGQSYEEPIELFDNQVCDIGAVLANPTKRKIVLDGFFQQSQYYTPHMSKIREWFSDPRPMPKELSEVCSSDLLIYIRLGDYFFPNININRTFVSLTHQFYESAIEMSSPRRIYIASDGPDHPFLATFNKYKPTILKWKQDEKAILDLISARCFNKIAISCSSFTWWAMMLSEASQIFFPIDEDGIWSMRYNDLTWPKNGNPGSIDLRIDEPRFTYIYNCPTIKTNRLSHGVVPLPAESSLSPFHRCSKAFWYK